MRDSVVVTLPRLLVSLIRKSVLIDKVPVCEAACTGEWGKRDSVVVTLTKVTCSLDQGISVDRQTACM